MNRTGPNAIQRFAARMLGLDWAVKAPLSAFKNWNVFYGEEPYHGSTQYPDTPQGWLDAATYNVWAKNSIKARSSAVAQTPMKLYEYSKNSQGDWDRTEVEDHDVLTMLENV